MQLASVSQLYIDVVLCFQILCKCVVRKSPWFFDGVVVAMVALFFGESNVQQPGFVFVLPLELESSWWALCLRAGRERAGCLFERALGLCAVVSLLCPFLFG